ncbi:hypothetical protein PF007_g32682 [Phytophthora fragariae]|uniref:Uncharacterized protein n=3 Tax=Phytophthora fragariae TaxID=53985 RepID=A0A6A3PA82_9STRA|nr:hypothetical protein PF007_g32682 [Phytophthora fragariae]
MQHILRQDDRIDNLQAKMEGAPPQDKSKNTSRNQVNKKTNPSRDGLPSRDMIRVLVALMKLFVADDLKLDPSMADYLDQVFALGKKVEVVVLAFLNARDIKSRGSRANCKHRHDLYRKET